MSATQAFEIIAVIAIAIAIGAGVGLAIVYRRLQRYQRDQYVILGSRGNVDIVEHVSGMDDKIANIRLAVEDLTLASRDHDVRIDSCLSRVGIVRFDAYQDLGGRQSTAVAFLNSSGDGVVVTTVVSRDFARMYVKLLKEGAPDVPLAPEEQEAVDQAKGTKPFTIRPRVETAGSGMPRDSAEVAISPDKPVSLGIPGFRPQTDRDIARENRRRKREGLPPLTKTLAQSATGFSEPHTPGVQLDSEASMAEQYLMSRRGSAGGGKTVEDAAAQDDALDFEEPDGL